MPALEVPFDPCPSVCGRCGTRGEIACARDAPERYAHESRITGREFMPPKLRWRPTRGRTTLCQEGERGERMADEERARWHLSEQRQAGRAQRKPVRLSRRDTLRDWAHSLPSSKRPVGLHAYFRVRYSPAPTSLIQKDDPIEVRLRAIIYQEVRETRPLRCFERERWIQLCNRHSRETWLAGRRCCAAGRRAAASAA